MRYNSDGTNYPESNATYHMRQTLVQYLLLNVFHRYNMLIEIDHKGI